MTTTQTNETTTEENAATLCHLDPQVLIAHPGNPRKKLRDIDLLAASMGIVGVLEPLTVVEDEEGYKILFGWRRANAAVKANLATVPCLVYRGRSTEDVLVLAAQVAENTNRDALTEAEEAAAYHQMRLGGMSLADIAKTGGRKRTYVAEAIKVAENEVALAVATRHDLTLEQASAIAEFAEQRDVVKELTVLAVRNPGSFEHRVSRLRQDRERVDAHAAVAADCVKRGVTVIERPEYGDRSIVAIRDLYDDKGHQLDAKRHERCPGHAVAIVTDWRDTHAVGYCTDWKANGHSNRAKATPVPDSPEADTARAERREVIENNKSWRASEPVRRQFVADLCARKSAPKGMLRFAVRDALRDPWSFARFGDELFGAFSGTGEDSRGRLRKRVGAAVVEDASDARLPLVLFAHVAASVEEQMGVHTWRLGRAEREASYLSFLAEQGYALCEIEQRVVNQAVNPAAALSLVADDEDEDDAWNDSEGVDEDANGEDGDEPVA